MSECPTTVAGSSAVVRRDRLVAMVARIAGSDAEDVVQEAMLRLESDPVSLRASVEVDAWLRRVCLNLAFNRRRDLRRWRERAMRGGVAAAERAAESPEAAALRAEEQELVRSTLDRLDERHRSILMLRYSGFSYAEIGASLQMPTSSVGTTIARAERAFRIAYEEHSYDRLS
jgi:RNA polymerase sigma factor (sigma-70 family)